MPIGWTGTISNGPTSLKGFRSGHSSTARTSILLDAEVFLEVKPPPFLHEAFKLEELCKNFERNLGWVVTAENQDAVALASNDSAERRSIRGDGSSGIAKRC